MTVYIRMMDLPYDTKAFVHKNIDCSYTVVLNSHMTREQNLKSYLHELEHTKHKDLCSHAQADEIEAERHHETEHS